jgi:DNA/RNA endonuclease YhcR with UshA esterase domain
MGTGVAEVVLPIGLAAQFGDAPALSAGMWISVTGSVSEFRGSRQILPAAAADVKILAPAEIPPIELRPIGALGKPLLGQWVAVQGLVTDVSPFKQGMRIQLQDTEGNQILAVVFDSAWQQVPFSQTLAVNDSVIVQGELASYRGDLEIVPEMGSDVGRE